MAERPARVFIVRHGERKDHVDPQYHVGNERPHDSPLTDNGKLMAQLLGKHLVTQRGVNPGYITSKVKGEEGDDNKENEFLFASKVIVLTSPLQRCVETSHAICSGIVAATGAPQGTTIVPMYLETGIMEGPQWLNYDVEKARLIKIEHLVENPTSSEHKDINLHPVVQPYEALKTVVRTEHLMAPRPGVAGLPGGHPTTGACVVPADLEPRHRERMNQVFYNTLHPRVKARHSKLSGEALEAFQKEQVIVEDAKDGAKESCRGRVRERTNELARIIGGSDLFAGMDVILVGHGETTALVNNNFPNLKPDCAFHGSPYYTAWTELVYENGEWATAKGVSQFEVPHLVEATVDTSAPGIG